MTPTVVIGVARGLGAWRTVVLVAVVLFWVVGPITTVMATVARNGVEAAPQAAFFLPWALAGWWIAVGLWRRWHPEVEAAG